MKNLFLSFSLLLITAVAFSQDDIPAAVKETFEKQYPNAQNVQFEDNLLNVWINFTLGNDKMRANYTRKGQWKNTEKEMSFDQLPLAVQDGFKKSKYADREVEETKLIMRAGGTERYRIKAKKNGLQKKYLYFNEDGRLVEDNITL